MSAPETITPSNVDNIDAASVSSTERANALLPSFGGAMKVWTKIGFLSFGGPAGQIALLHRVIVDELRWVSETRFLQALNFCTLLPGPEAQQMATYLGWLMHGVKGGLAAGLMFVIPGAAVILALSLVYALYGDVPLVSAAFFGLKCAVLVLVLEAVIRIGKRALKGTPAWLLAGTAFMALFIFNVSFPVVVIVAGLVGYFAPTAFNHGSHGKAKGDHAALLDNVLAIDPDRPRRQAASAFKAGLVGVALWIVPTAAIMVMFGGTYADIAWFFSKMAVVTVGGAYAVLSYVAQDAVQTYHWLTAQEMLTGLGLAETTPGPLILVLQFVGFLAGFRAPESLHGVPGGIAASALVLWVTFAPCFFFVFLGAPIVERLQQNKALSGALAAITAAVVGVVANLAVWFALRVLFREHFLFAFGPARLELPMVSSFDIVAIGLSLVAAVCLFPFKIGVIRTLAITAVVGLVLRYLSIF